MAKKKKPTLKSNPNRGFATTSQAKKVDVDSLPSSSLPTPGTSTPRSTPEGNPDSNETADQIIKAMNRAGSENRDHRRNPETFDPKKVREQELQNLAEKLGEKVEKEVSRVYKVS